MAAQHFTTEVEVMHAGSVRVRDVNAAIDADLRSLLSKLEALFSTWQGTAAQSFHGLKDQWVLNEQKLTAALEGIADTLDVNARSYEATEAAATADFDSAGSALR